MRDLLIVTASWDADAAVWSAISADLGGLFIQAPSWKTLVESIPEAVLRLLPRRPFHPARDIAIEVIAHASTRASTSHA